MADVFSPIVQQQSGQPSFYKVSQASYTQICPPPSSLTAMLYIGSACLPAQTFWSLGA